MVSFFIPAHEHKYRSGLEYIDDDDANMLISESNETQTEHTVHQKSVLLTCSHGTYRVKSRSCRKTTESVVILESRILCIFSFFKRRKPTKNGNPRRTNSINSWRLFVKSNSYSAFASDKNCFNNVPSSFK